MARHPIQKVVRDEKGTPRFRENGLVRYLLDCGPHDLNHLAKLPGIKRGDWVQLAQLIGYSVSGFDELSYVTDGDYKRAGHELNKLKKREASKGES